MTVALPASLSAAQSRQYHTHGSGIYYTQTERERERNREREGRRRGGGGGEKNEQLAGQRAAVDLSVTTEN